MNAPSPPPAEDQRPEPNGSGAVPAATSEPPAPPELPGAPPPAPEPAPEPAAPGAPAAASEQPAVSNQPAALRDAAPPPETAERDPRGGGAGAGAGAGAENEGARSHERTGPESGDYPAGDADDDQEDDEGATPTETPADYQFRRVTANGATAVGPDAKAYNYQIYGGRQITVLRSVRTPELIRAEREVHVLAETSFKEQLETLRANHLLYMRGRPGSGRWFLAEMVAASIVGDNRVVGVTVAQTDVTLPELADVTDLLTPGHGVVLEVPNPGLVNANTVDTFATRARASGAYLIILNDLPDVAETAIRPYEATHTLPDPKQVLDRHLSQRLLQRRRCFAGCRPCTGACRLAFVSACLAHKGVVEALGADPRPGQVVELAEVLAAASGRSEEEITTALARRQVKVRQLAAKLLAGSDAESRDPEHAPRRQAFQITYALFDRHPLADVFDAGLLLLQVLWEAQGGQGRPSLALFDGGVDQLFNLDGEVVIVGSGGEDSAEEQARQARLADPRLLEGLLDVAWNDFDIRIPLLTWIDRLVSTRRIPVALRAARVAGLLARYDFGQVYRHLIGPWARSVRGNTRQAAAWALEITARDGRLLGQVRQQVRDWVGSTSPQLHDAAARGYGTQIWVDFPDFVDDVLSDIRTLAERPDMQAGASVAYALRSLYQVAPKRVRRTVAVWSSGAPDRAEARRLRLHAARCFTLLANLKANPPKDLWPALLAHSSADERDDLVRLWRAVLLEPRTALRAWRILRAWLRLADQDPDLGTEMIGLVSRVLAGRLAGRGRFYLRAWLRDEPTSGTIRHLASTVDSKSYHSGEYRDHF